ncbi:MAG: chloramphenicol acetyltransferase [Pseudomonadota bacterium]
MPTLGQAPFLHDSASVHDSRLGRFVEIGAGANLLDVDMGDYSYCARFTDIAHTEIGKFANIAAHTRINPSNHPVERASLHHFMYRASYYWPDAEDEAAVFDWRRATRCSLGHDTWIGHAAIILPGRSVGTGAVVGAGAVVSRDVAPYTIVVGNPARPIRARFPGPIAERLQALAWWDWDHTRLRHALEDFRHLSVEAFLEKHGG